ncbi:hypothetical protein PAL_GLEAN10002204 [Pteropus alecto]|uniref:Uncharacterized protein n=1 Tax=Pteropus alecto TaxID=9402 RepID=L5K303_PTEAL|nr:hypothetical protein PAL_GLEAN10002204 [Pteropus alecto]
MKCCSCGSTEPKPAAEEDEEESIPAPPRVPRPTPYQLPDLHVSRRRNRNHNPPPKGPPPVSAMRLREATCAPHPLLSTRRSSRLPMRPSPAGAVCPFSSRRPLLQPRRPHWVPFPAASAPRLLPRPPLVPSATLPAPDLSEHSSAPAAPASRSPLRPQPHPLSSARLPSGHAPAST